MSFSGFTLFDTAIGRCGIAWTESGIARVQLPEMDAVKTEQCLVRHVGRDLETRAEGKTAAVAAAIEAIQALLQGGRPDLSKIELDLGGVPEFYRRVYAVACEIETGSTLTYGDIARRLGQPGSARAVGQALGANPLPLLIPCHRVLAAGHRPGGFSAPGGAATKLRLLAIEGATPGGQLSLFPDQL